MTSHSSDRVLGFSNSNFRGDRKRDPLVVLVGESDSSLVSLQSDLTDAGFACSKLLPLSHLPNCAMVEAGAVILLDLMTIDAKLLADLGELDGWLARNSVRLVLSTDIASLDAVFSIMSESRPEILVSATQSDWLLAAARAALPANRNRLHERDKADRLLLLRMAEQMEALARKLDGIPQFAQPYEPGMIRGDADDESAFRFEAPKQSWRGSRQSGDRLVSGGGSRSNLPNPKVLRRILRQRQQRNRVFGVNLFSDPAWEMLLDLAVNQTEGRRVSVSSLCLASGAPATTALRWLSMLIDAGLVERQPDSEDRRRAFIVLTIRANEGLEQWFADLDAACGI